MPTTWQPAPTELTRKSVFLEVYGDTGTGRTSFALSSPAPIALIHASEKIEGIIQPFARDKEIRLCDFGQAIFNRNSKDIEIQAGKVWSILREAWYDAFTWARTIILDTHTEAWELLRLAAFGALKPVKGRVDANYGPVNAEWRSLFKHFRHQDKANVIVIGQTKEEYKGTTGMGQRTGRTIRSGQKEIPYIADAIVRTSHNNGEFASTIEKGWWNAHSEGIELSDDMNTFSQILALMTETDMDQWEK